MRKIIKHAFLLGFLTIGAFGSCNGEAPVSVAVVVNNDVITSYDLDKRLKMVLDLSGMPIAPSTEKLLRPQILRSMIDEQLQEQAAAAVGIRIENEAVEAAIRDIEQAQGLLPGDIAAKLESLSIPVSVLKNQIHANIAWVELVRAKYGPILHVTDYEIKHHIEKQKKEAGSKQYQVQEIFLLSNDQAPIEEAEVFAKKMREELLRGASFEAFAQQFSDAPSAVRGGQIGWTSKGGIDDTLGAALDPLKPGDISQPIRANGGVYLLRVNAVKNPQYETSSTLDFAEILVPLYFVPNEQALQEKMQEVRQVTQGAKSVEDFEAVAQSLGATHTAFDNKALETLPDELKSKFKNLPTGVASAVYRSPRGLHVFFIKNRRNKTALVGVDSPQEAHLALKNKKLEAAAASYLRELRRKAHIKQGE